MFICIGLLYDVSVKLSDLDQKHSDLRKALTTVFYVADPIGIRFDRDDEYDIEAVEIAKRLRVMPEPTPQKCAQLCYQVFVEYFDEKLANVFKDWKQVGACVHWLYTNEGKWEIG